MFKAQPVQKTAFIIRNMQHSKDPKESNKQAIQDGKKKKEARENWQLGIRIQKLFFQKLPVALAIYNIVLVANI